ncbi:MAG: class I SAM-dependent methyltransferase [Anaerolineae bacterium]|nr:class I SAM-dependent methyltransferase [Anaerolineae bacterium]
MTEKIAVDLGHVQKTLLLPLWGRAYESKKPNPLLVDQAAVNIIDSVDYDFTDIAQNTHVLSQLAWIMRSLCIDKVITQFLVNFPNASIVNIGCGLDTTFERVDNGHLTWYDLDLPDVIDLRCAFMQESERRQFIASSFLDTGWLRQIKHDNNVLFIAAGVFYYFEEHQIRPFLKRLADLFPASEIVFDVSSPYGIKVANKMVIKNTGLDENSFLKWGLDSNKTLLAWDERFKLLATYFYFRQKNLRLPLKTRLYGMLSDFMRIQYLVHLQLGECDDFLSAAAAYKKLAK